MRVNLSMLPKFFSFAPAGASTDTASGDVKALLKSPPLGWPLYVVSAVVNLLALALPITVLQVYDRVLPNASYNTLVALAVGLFLVIIADAVLKYCRAYVVNWAAAAQKHKLSVAALETMLAENPQRFGRIPVSEHMDRLTAITGLTDQFGVNARIVAIDAAFIPVFAAMIVFVGGPILIAPIILFAVFGYLGLRRAQEIRAVVSERESADARKYDFVIEVLSAIQTVKAFAMEPLILRRFERLQASTSAILQRMIVLNSAAQTFSSLYVTLSTISIISVGALLVINGRLTVGGLACCMLLSSQLLQPLLRSFSAWSAIQLASHRRDRAAHIFAENGQRRAIAPAKDAPRRDPSAVSFRNVTIGYGEGKPLFENVDATIESGETVAIRGADGSGRTSLFRAIIGDLRPTAGEIIIGEHVINDRNAAYIRASIRYVPSQPRLFRGTILDNLTVFGETPIKDALVASRLVGLDREVVRMPKGYDTPIKGSSSRDLPTAIAQLICIARAIATHPSLLLLDEANSILDSARERQLTQALLKLRGTMTIVLATHRPSFLRVASKVYDIEGGGLSLSEISAPNPLSREAS